MSRTTYFQLICENPKCENHESSGSHKLVGVQNGVWAGECGKCGTVNYRVAAEKVIKKQRYPYYNDTTGTTFQDKDHEKSYVKENNLTAVS